MTSPKRQGPFAVRNAATRRSGLLALTASMAVAVAMASAACGRDAGSSNDAGLTLSGTLGGVDTAGYARALEPVPMTFPQDHGPHEDFKTEWWYVTGHLDAADGRSFGYQFTLFRSALSPDPVGDSSSAWATRQAYMGHFAVSDIDGERFFAAERFARGAAGIAGAEGEPLRVWLEDWVFSGAGPSSGPMRVQATQESAALDLTLEAGKGIFLNGDRGWSPKGAGEGNASYYYTMPRMPTTGSVIVDGDTLAVTGSSWLDREWSTSVLSEGQVGWDWFALQLDDGRELMAYRIRRDDGSADPASEGILYGEEGSRRFAWDRELMLDELDRWRASDGGAEYPSAWRIRVPSEDLELEVRPLFADQELRLTFRYWEGAVAVTGEGPNGPITGRGYVELTGYDTGSSGAPGFGRTGN